MTPWTESTQGQFAGSRRIEPAETTGAGSWRAFQERCGTRGQAFVHRLARARLLYLRRAENPANWLALSLLCALALQVLPIDNARGETRIPVAPDESLRSDRSWRAANEQAIFESTLPPHR